MDHLRPSAERLRVRIRANQKAALGPFFQKAAAAVFAAQLGLSGCALSHGTEPRLDGGFDGGAPDGGRFDGGHDAGLDGGGWLCADNVGIGAAELDVVRERLGLDFLALYPLEHGELYSTDFVYSPAIESGEPCGGADARAACLDALEAERAYRGPTSAGWYTLALATRGSDVLLAYSISELIDPSEPAIYTVATPEEAALAALLGEGIRSLECSVDDVAGGPEAGWQLRMLVIDIPGCGDALQTLARYTVEADATVRQDEVIEATTLVGYGPPCVGRRPAGMHALDAARSDSELGSFWGSVSTLESAAVLAFDHIAAELRYLGAPAALVDAALAAKDDEVRHAAMTDALARAYGVTPAPAAVDSFAPRSLFAFALDNATEGCVRETYGALYGEFQALAAQEPAVRETMREIAADETRHASLSWQIAAWAEAQLSMSERETIRAAQQEAIDALMVESQRPIPEALAEEAGVPRPAQAAELLAALRAGLWN